MTTVEFKSYEFQIKSHSIGGNFEGYASVFNVLDTYGDIILPGSFGVISPRSVGFLLEHNIQYKIGTLSQIEEDRHGLFVSGNITNLSVIKGMKNGILNGLSIGFFIKQQYIDSITNVRYIGRINLIEVSLVQNPANKYALGALISSGTPARSRNI